MEESETVVLVLGSSDASVQADLLSQEASAEVLHCPAHRASLCVCLSLADGVPSPQGEAEISGVYGLR